MEATPVSGAQLAAALEAMGAPPDLIAEALRIIAIASEAALTAAVITLALGALLGFLVSLGLRRKPAETPRIPVGEAPV